MRFVFHAMLGFAIGIVATGLTYGTVARHRVVHEGALRVVSRGGDMEVNGRFEASVPAPLPLWPRSGAVVAPGASLAWHLAEGTDGAELELSTTPAFEPGATERIDVDGTTVKLPAAIGAGVWYWRLHGREQDVVGDAATAPRIVRVVVASEEDPAWG